MYQEISAALASSNIAVRLVADVFKTVQDAKVRQAVSDLQNTILDLQSKLFGIQSQYAELSESKRALEHRLNTYENWDAEAAKYSLKEIAKGILVYTLKPEHQGSQPLHYLCPHCFGDRKRSILQKPSPDNSNLFCHACKFDVNTESSDGFSGWSLD